MKTYTDAELKEILAKHWKWLKLEDGGIQADLSYADLRSANLSYANLSYADLRYADLSYANLSYADLSYADLRSANLRSANLRYADLSYADLRSADLRSADLSKTLYDGINWLSYIGIVPINGKARAYKVITAEGIGISYGGINYLKKKTVEVDRFDSDVNVHCSYGVNLATLQWCLNNKSDSTNRLLIMEFDCTPDNVCCPIGTDGKFRVKKATGIGECDWMGNLLSAKAEGGQP